MSRRRFDRLLRLAVFVLDSCVIMLTFLLAYHLRASLGRLNDPATLNQLLLQIMPLATALWVAAIAARVCRTGTPESFWRPWPTAPTSSRR